MQYLDYYSFWFENEDIDNKEEPLLLIFSKINTIQVLFSTFKKEIIFISSRIQKNLIFYLELLIQLKFINNL